MTQSMQFLTILSLSFFLSNVKGLLFHIINSVTKNEQFLGQTTEIPNYTCNEGDDTVKFTQFSSSHSASQPASNCSLQQCHVSSSNSNSCRSSSTPCFDYRTLTNSSYCAPGILCSILELCDNTTYTCASNTSVCIVNSCCSPQAVCLPLQFTNFCILGNDTLYSNL
jgi:hypothetical protein